MPLVVLGLNHRTAPVEVREKLAFGDWEIPEVLAALHERAGLHEGLVLSTCNRTEIYGTAADVDGAAAALARFLEERAGAKPGGLARYLYGFEHGQVAPHLFRVACGIDSMVLGESEILGQVKAAVERARQCGSLRLVLGTLCSSAISVGKRARTETDIGRGALSVGSVALELAQEIFGSLNGRRALVLGAGQVAKLTIKHLVQAGISELMVVSRTRDRAAALAEAFGGRPADFSEFEAELVKTDVVICQTGAPYTLVKPDMVHRVMRARRWRPLFFIDIAVPRDVEPEVGRIADVFLYDIDDLERIVEVHRTEREAEVVRVEAIIAEEADRFHRWLFSRQAVPMIRELQAEAERLRQMELEWARSRMGDLTPEQQRLLEQALHRLKQKFLARPVAAIKRLAGEGNGVATLETVSRLFGLKVEASLPSEADSEDKEEDGSGI